MRNKHVTEKKVHSTTKIEVFSKLEEAEIIIAKNSGG